MTASADKARAQRLLRLAASLDERLEHPDAAVETLMWELRSGELHPDDWERLHAAAVRDGKEAELTQVYEKVTADHRLKQLTPAERASLLLHAADFFQGVLGDRAAAEGYLWRVLEEVPDQADAFGRLERKFNATRDRVRLAELYALVANQPPRLPAAHAKAAQDIVSLLPSKSPLSDEACRKLLVLLPVNQNLLGVLETHCRNTGRFALACELLEESLAGASKAGLVERRRRLVELYVGDAKTPEKAISHVEVLLEQDPSDAQARAAVERLVRIPEVASRAAAALQAARRHQRERA
jgi:tetratricopeptide (TPR) repeat protein